MQTRLGFARIARCLSSPCKKTSLDGRVIGQGARQQGTGKCLAVEKRNAKKIEPPVSWAGSISLSPGFGRAPRQGKKTNQWSRWKSKMDSLMSHVT